MRTSLITTHRRRPSPVLLITRHDDREVEWSEDWSWTGDFPDLVPAGATSAVAAEVLLEAARRARPMAGRWARENPGQFSTLRSGRWRIPVDNGPPAAAGFWR